MAAIAVPARHNVKRQMIDFLTGNLPMIYTKRKAIWREGFLEHAEHFLSRQKKWADEILGQIQKCFCMRFWDYHHVARRARQNIEKSECMIVLIHFLCRNFAFYNSTKYTLTAVHNFLFC